MNTQATIVDRCRVTIHDETSPLFLDALCRSLQAEGIDAQPFQPDQCAEAGIVLVNVDSPTTDVETLAAKVRSDAPQAKVLLLTRRVTEAHHRLARRMDAAGIVARHEAFGHLVSTLRLVHEGRSIPLPRAASDPTEDSISRLLTTQEQRILRLMAEGLRNDEMARLLSISVHTVRTHVQNIHTKLGVTSRLAAVARAGRPATSGGRI